ncbi:recombinase family protein [Nonomuraea sp. NPDC050547]|uniref:recombinase family protein n=1 Tax=Nonomuraea sp. NPDC050547 TaxID=3364368 RepID=UPI0037B5B969
MSGVVGRPPRCPLPVVHDAVRLHYVEGVSKKGIARMFNAQSIPTPSGGSRWTASHVYTLLGTTRATRLRDELLTVA